MVKAVKEHDDQFTPELEERWKEILTYGADFVRSGYEE